MDTLSKLSTEQLHRELEMVRVVLAPAGTYGTKPNGTEYLAKMFKHRQRIRKELERRREQR